MEIKDLKVGDEVYFEYWGGWRNIYATNKRLSSIFGLPKAKKKVTNADKIRSMTDEELYDFLCSFASRYTDISYPCAFRAKLFYVMGWLKQPAKED